MNKYLFLFIILLLYSCATFNSIKKNQKSDFERVVYTKNNDTLILQRDSLHIVFYTKNYIHEYEDFYKTEDRGKILMAIENNIRLSLETSKMIEENGTAILRSILSKENFEKFDKRIPLRVYVILSLNDLTISEYKILFLTKNANNLYLTDSEIEKLFDFCKMIHFIYTGNEFKNEKIQVPAGWMFTITK